MKKIERRLNSAANKMLPGAEAKERTRSECFEERVFAEVPALATQTANRSAPHGARMSQSRKFTVVVAFVLIACLMVGLACYFALAKVPVPVSATYVNISINPEFGITADESDIVTEVTALNEDAAVVLYGMDLVGLTVTEATNAIVAESAALGYLNTGEDGSMEILAVNENGAKEDAVANSILESLNALFDENDWQTEIRNAACPNPDCSGGGNGNGSGNGNGNGNSNGNGYGNGNGNGNGSGYQYKYSFGRNDATAGKTALAQRVSNRLGNSFGECVRLSAASLGEMISDACKDTVTRVQNALRQSFESDTELTAEYETWQQTKREYDDFVQDVTRVAQMLKESNGHLSVEDWETVKDLLHHPYLGSILELINSSWSNLEGIFTQVESLIEDAISYFEQDVKEVASAFAQEMNAWKKDFIAQFIN